MLWVYFISSFSIISFHFVFRQQSELSCFAPSTVVTLDCMVTLDTHFLLWKKLILGKNKHNLVVFKGYNKMQICSLVKRSECPKSTRLTVCYYNQVLREVILWNICSHIMSNEEWDKEKLQLQRLYSIREHN